MPLTLTHILQPSLLVADLSKALDHLHALFGIYPSERSRITSAGVNNAVFPLGRQTYIEIIAPYEADSASARVLQRDGPGWYMLSCDIQRDKPNDVEKNVIAAGMRIVQRAANDHLLGVWRLHPRDVHGVQLNLAMRMNEADNTLWAGSAWPQFVQTNTRVLHSVRGISVLVKDLSGPQTLFKCLGLDFAPAVRSNGCAVAEAELKTGTRLQLRSPRDPHGAAATWFERRGEGLYHLAFDVADRRALAARLADADVTIAKRTRRAIWTEPDAILGVPMEFRFEESAAARPLAAPAKPRRATAGRRTARDRRDD